VVVGGVLRAGEGQWRSWKLTMVSPRPEGIRRWPTMESFSAGGDSSTLEPAGAPGPAASVRDEGVELAVVQAQG
jgi:hypothetical protein